MITFHVLTDFSDAAANALQYAARLAQYVGGCVRIWHVLPPPESREAAYFGTLGTTRSIADIKHELHQMAHAINSKVLCGADVENSFRENKSANARTANYCRAELLHGPPAQMLTRVIGTGRRQIVVVGNSNPDKDMTAARYSTALYLVRELMQPLLVVPCTFQDQDIPRRVVIDTDRRAVRLPLAAATIPGLLVHLTESGSPLLLGQEPSDVEVLLQRIIPAVVGIHVYTSEVPPGLEEVAYQLRQTGLLDGVAHTVASTRHSSIEEGIRSVAAYHQADLLTFVTRQRMFPGTHFLYSVSAGLLAHSRIPVLTVPEV